MITSTPDPTEKRSVSSRTRKLNSQEETVSVVCGCQSLTEDETRKSPNTTKDYACFRGGRKW